MNAQRLAYKRVLCLIFGFLLIALQSCQKKDLAVTEVQKDNEGAVTALPYLWRIPINAEGDWRNLNYPLYDNMVFGENVIIPTTNGPKSRNLSMISSEDGSRIWDWSDWYQPETEGGSFRWNARDGHLFHWVTGSRRYTIDVRNGNTVMKDRNAALRSFSSRVSNRGCETYMLSDVAENGIITNAVFRGDMKSPEYELLLKLPYSLDTIGENDRVKGAVLVLPFRQNGKEYLVVKSNQSYPGWKYDVRLNLYDLDQEAWVYKDVVAAAPKQNNAGSTKIFNQKLYFSAGRELLCYDILSGARIWQRDFPHDFTFSGFEIAEGIMVANCENQVCYGIHPENGQVVWASEGSGTSSHLQNRIMDGVAYFSGGGPARLYAKDIHTGKTLWKLDAYEYEENNASWQDDVNLVPGKEGEKGKVIVRTRRYAYCFEAAR